MKKNKPVYKQRNDRINSSLQSIIECKANEVIWMTSCDISRPSLFISISPNVEFEIIMN